MDESGMLLEGIAIIGMSGRFPGARTVDQLWSNLETGIDSITRFGDADLEDRFPPETRAQANFVRARAIIDGVDQIETGPVSAFRKSKHEYHLEPIPELWKPLLRELKCGLKTAVADWKQSGVATKDRYDPAGVPSAQISLVGAESDPRLPDAVTNDAAESPAGTKRTASSPK